MCLPSTQPKIEDKIVVNIKEDKIRSVLSAMTGTRSAGLLKFHDDHLDEILCATASSGNHQSWKGGLHDHLVHCFILAQDLYVLLHERIGPGPHSGQFINGYYDSRPIPFSLASAIVVLYFHDIEKIFNYGNKPSRYPQRVIESKDAWYLGILPHKYDIVFDDQEYNALKYVHGEGEDYRKDRRVASPLAGFVHSIDCLSARVLWQIKNFDYGLVKNSDYGLVKTGTTLSNICRDAVGKRVKYTGTNADEYDSSYAAYVEGEGLCTEQHDSHGLYIVVRHDDRLLGSIAYVSPSTVEIIK